MKRTLILCTFLICLTVVQSRIKPTKRTTQKSVPYIPKELRKRNPNVYTNLRIPNKQFCEDRPLKPAEHYLVLPWWYHYCQNLIEKTTKYDKKGVYYLPLYKKILDKLQAYKKNKMMQQQRVIRELTERHRDPSV